MSAKSEKLIKIIMPDLLNYLEMVESGEIIEKRLKQKNTFDKTSKIYKLKIEGTTQNSNKREE